MKYLRLLFFFLVVTTSLAGYEELYLRENLNKAKKGDYIVTAQGKTYTLLHIHERSAQTITIQEISVPCHRIPRMNFSWKYWVQQGAPGYTAWIHYTVDLKTAQMSDIYAYTGNQWQKAALPDQFLPTLLNLRFTKVPREDMRRIGAQPKLGIGVKWRPIWQPLMIVNGQRIEGVTFDAWKTWWPKDGSDLAGKMIEVYLPEENSQYPSYFPYWLQISGIVGKAKVRIVDSGTNLTTPQQFLLGCLPHNGQHVWKTKL